MLCANHTPNSYKKILLFKSVKRRNQRIRNKKTKKLMLKTNKTSLIFCGSCFFLLFFNNNRFVGNGWSCAPYKVAPNLPANLFCSFFCLIFFWFLENLSPEHDLDQECVHSKSGRLFTSSQTGGRQKDSERRTLFTFGPNFVF